MTKRLIQHGNSAALVIDLETELEVVTDGRNLILSPFQPRQTEDDLLASLERINKAHGRTLEKLAH